MTSVRHATRNSEINRQNNIRPVVHPDIAGVLREPFLYLSRRVVASAKLHSRRMALDFPITRAYERDTSLDANRTTRDENSWQAPRLKVCVRLSADVNRRAIRETLDYM